MRRASVVVVKLPLLQYSPLLLQLFLATTPLVGAALWEESKNVVFQTNLKNVTRSFSPRQMEPPIPTSEEGAGKKRRADEAKGDGGASPSVETAEEDTNPLLQLKFSTSQSTLDSAERIQVQNKNKTSLLRGIAERWWG